jgi:uncharacterized membrane protein
VKLKTIFTTGFLTILPLAVTIYVFYVIFNFLENLIGGLIESVFNFHIPGIGFASGLALILLIGFIASNIIGNRLINFLIASFSASRLPAVFTPAPSKLLMLLRCRVKTPFSKLSSLNIRARDSM